MEIVLEKDFDKQLNEEMQPQEPQEVHEDSLPHRINALVQIAMQQFALFIHPQTLKDDNDKPIEELFIFGWVKLFDDLFENEASKDAFELISSDIVDYVKTYKFNFMHNEEYTFTAVIDMTIGFEIKLMKELKVIVE
jgi:hypothetical protein